MDVFVKAISKSIYNQDPSKEKVPLDEYGKKAFMENFGWTLIWGGLYRGSLIHSLIYVSVSVFHTVFLMYTAYLTLGTDMSILSESCHFIVFLSSTCGGAVNALYYRKEVNSLFNAVGKGMFKYGDTMDDATEKEIRLKKEYWQNEKIFYAKAFNTLIFFVGSYIAFIRPITDYFNGKYAIPHPDDNINRSITVAVWYPFSTKTWGRHMVLFTFVYYIIAISMGVVLGLDTVHLCLSSEFCCEMEVVGITLRRLDRRARNMYTKKFGKNVESPSSDPFFHQCVKKCLSESVQHHIILIKHFHNLKKLNFFILLCLMTGGTFMLCLSGILLVNETISIGGKINSLLFLTAELIHTFLHCGYGERLKGISTAIGNDLYHSEWIDYPHILKPYFVIIQCRSNIPLALSAGGFMDASLNTFANVLSSAYSYFNLVRAMN